MTGGLAEGEGADLVEAPAWALLDDVRFDKRGYLRRRPAYESVGESSYFFAKNNGAPVSRNASAVAKYSRDLAAWSTSVGNDGAAILPCAPMDVSVGMVSNADAYPASACVARCASDGSFCVVYMDDALIYARIFDAAGLPIGAAKNLTVGGATFGTYTPVVCCVGTTFAVFAASNAAALYGWTGGLSGGSASWSSSTTIKAATGAPFDATANDDDDEFVLAYWNGSATVLNRLNTSLASQGTATITSSTGATNVGVRYDSGRVLALYQTNPGNLYAASYSDDLGATHFGHTSVSAVASGPAGEPAACLNGSTWCIAWRDNTEGMRYETMTTGGTASGTVTSAGLRIRRAAEPFVSGGVVFIPAYYVKATTPHLQPTGLVMAVYGSGSSRKLGVVARFMSDSVTAAESKTTSRTIGYDTEFSFAALGGAGEYAGSPVASHAAVVSLRLPGGCSRFAEYDGNTYWGGGQLWCYDGTHVFENTPHAFPENISVTFAGAAGGLSTGSYSWKAVYEWEDSSDVLHRSAPSLSVTGTAAATNTATVKVPKLYGSARDGVGQHSYSVALYRTTVGGSVFYLASRTSAADLSSTTAGYWDVSDGLADAYLDGILYTEGGILEANAPPPAWDVTIARGRMWLVSADRRSEVWYSKKLTRGVAPEFNAAQVIDVGRGKISCVEGMDDKVIVFTSEGIFAIYGEGPNDAGQGGTFTDPQPIASDTGGLSREVASGPFGIVFGGHRGAYLLTRGLESQFVGDAVSESLGYGTWLGATTLPLTNEVLIKGAVAGDSMVWNYGTNQWSAWNKPSIAATGNSFHAMGFVSADGLTQEVYLAMRTGSAMMSEDGADYYDTAPSTDASIGWIARSGWVRLGAIHGFQRIWKLRVAFSKNGTAQLRIKYGTRTDALTTIKTFTSAELDATNGFLEVQVPIQKCSEMRFELSLISSGAGQYGEIEIRGVTMVCGVKAGTKPLASTSRA